MRYRRVIIPGATYFFTVNLQNRKSKLLIQYQYIDPLRSAFRHAKHHYPFTIDAIVILPDHLHMIMTLPEDDANFSCVSGCGTMLDFRWIFSTNCTVHLSVS